MSVDTRERIIEQQRALVSAASIEDASRRIRDIAKRTPLEHSPRLSRVHGANVSLKLENLQPVRSYKLRGAGNRMALLNEEERARGVVTASAGNHAQGVALSAAELEIMADIFMPALTPAQKVDRVREFGGNNIRVHLIGDTFDEASARAQEMCKANGGVYVPPFNDPDVINGQGTVGLEILEQALEANTGTIDYVVVPIGGGGLAAGLGTYFAAMSPETVIVGVEPVGAAGMYASRQAGGVVTLSHIDPFVDGAAVKTPGDLTFAITQDVVEEIVLVPEGEVCEAMIDMFDKDGIIAEPAGALSVAALRVLGEDIRGANVVSVISGGNIGIARIAQIRERATEAEYARSPFGVCI